MDKKKIYIDPGHGGRDPGAVGNGMQEKDVCLDVSLRLGSLLNKDFSIMYSRDKDAAVPNRTKPANEWGADVFLSIHANAFGSDTAHGTEAFIFETCCDLRQAKCLARGLQDAFVSAMGTRDRGVKPDARSQHTGGLGVLRNSLMPAVLFELAFITAGPSHPDAWVLAHRRHDMALALADGLRRYFRADGGVPPVAAAEESAERTARMAAEAGFIADTAYWAAVMQGKTKPKAEYIKTMMGNAVRIIGVPKKS
jgi:N-acetylmuramoyl-L-alanine amidase